MLHDTVFYVKQLPSPAFDEYTARPAKGRHGLGVGASKLFKRAVRQHRHVHRLASLEQLCFGTEHYDALLRRRILDCVDDSFSFKKDKYAYNIKNQARDGGSRASLFFGNLLSFVSLLKFYMSKSII